MLVLITIDIQSNAGERVIAGGNKGDEEYVARRAHIATPPLGETEGAAAMTRKSLVPPKRGLPEADGTAGTSVARKKTRVRLQLSQCLPCAQALDRMLAVGWLWSHALVDLHKLVLVS